MVVDLALRPRVEPMSALSMSADFARVRSSLDGLVLACRVQIQAAAVLDERLRRGANWTSADAEAVILLVLIVRRGCVFAQAHVAVNLLGTGPGTDAESCCMHHVCIDWTLLVAPTALDQPCFPPPWMVARQLGVAASLSLYMQCPQIPPWSLL